MWPKHSLEIIRASSLAIPIGIFCSNNIRCTSSRDIDARFRFRSILFQLIIPHSRAERRSETEFYWAAQLWPITSLFMKFRNLGPNHSMRSMSFQCSLIFPSLKEFLIQCNQPYQSLSLRTPL